MRIPESLRAMGTDGFKISSLKQQSHKKKITKIESKENRTEFERVGPIRSPDFDDVEFVEPLAVDLRVERRRHPATTAGAISGLIHQPRNQH